MSEAHLTHSAKPHKSVKSINPFNCTAFLNALKNKQFVKNGVAFMNATENKSQVNNP